MSIWIEISITELWAFFIIWGLSNVLGLKVSVCVASIYAISDSQTELAGWIELKNNKSVFASTASIRQLLIVPVNSVVELKVVHAHSHGILCPGSSNCEGVHPFDRRQRNLEGMDFEIGGSDSLDQCSVPVDCHAIGLQCCLLRPRPRRILEFDVDDSFLKVKSLGVVFVDIEVQFSHIAVCILLSEKLSQKLITMFLRWFKNKNTLINNWQSFTASWHF